MHYLSRAEIEHATAVRTGLHDNYAWHRAIWKAFPGRPQAKRDFLFRVKTVSDGFRLFVLGPTKPVCPQWCPDSAWASKEVSPGFLEHNSYQFDLLANPTKKVTKLGADGKPLKNSVRKVLTGQAEQREWLFRKAAASGFTVSTSHGISIDPAGRYSFSKNHGRQETGLHVGIRYLGVLEVTDRNAFKEAFTRGIGSAKGFGFGMLLIQPINQTI